MKLQLNTNYLAAILIAAAVAGYFIVRGGVDAGGELLQGNPSAEQADVAPGITVVVDTPRRELRAKPVRLSGRTEAARAVTARSEVIGPVIEIPAVEGAEVAEGDPLCVIDVEARQARLDEARALLTTRRLELDSARELAERGHRSANQLAAVQASFDAAEAAVTQARIELDNTVIRAPFAGVFDEQLVEVGDYLSIGGACGVVAEMDPIRVLAQAAARDVRNIAVGDRAIVRLPNGETFEGQVRFVQVRADESTRTFRVEVEAPNPDRAVRAGESASIRFEGEPTAQSLVPTGVITLDAEGAIGVRVVDEDSIVRFAPVDLIEDTAEGSWVAGLDPDARVIVRGQDFVIEGREARTTTFETASAES